MTTGRGNINYIDIFKENKMIQAKTVLEAWDKTFETMDFSHLAQYLSEDFQVEYTTGEVDNLENAKSICC